ncbi:fungal-specific transcription factor domain-containing protein [Aspergillus caelatus]|uniref:Fungal-specific transcription factor domain-containing protein n=2 Tax=Aspergillus subgen. Circumdati TaxID=2720871 RepID=A0A5N7A8A3_9EURO|nr:fungal-specific transcription factor domain-containing protein [Aspergillus caelatus]KAE8365648.1 fungal-specific transcription factor domain-containing protein [Aspergillus caelatus]KAE8417860.1 fungal-specific transcription factor domain-containing protein [Aspergillus pseudocaelatus]
MGSRQRVSVACQACRKRRVKCDGVKPRCSRCATFQGICEYRHSEEKRKPPSKRYIQSLLSRIDHLERQVAEYAVQDDKASSKSISTHGSTVASQQMCHSTNASGGLNSVRELADLCGRLSLGEGQELRFFDSRSILAMIDDQIDERCHYHLLKFPADRNQRLGIGDVDVSQAVQRTLLSVFWTWQNSWQYLVHESAWNRSYTVRDNDYCTPVLLYAMLAVAARYSNKSDGYGTNEPSLDGTLFSSKAKQLIFEEIEAPRLPTVIAAALISIAELSLDLEPAGWTYIGIAVRMAYTLGLHTDSHQWVESGRITAEEAEIRSIAWWGCYMIEKFYSTALGRPSACNDRDIHTPLPTVLPEVEYRSFQGSFALDSGLNVPISYSITNFRYTCDMLRLVTSPMDEIYSADPKPKLEDRIAPALKTAIALSAFYDKIPSVIRLPSFASGIPVAVHIYYFHIHYHSLNILIHRPFISGQGTPAMPGIKPEIAHRNFSECTRSAETLTLILKEIEKHYSLRTATISIIHPALTAGIIHLVNLTLPYSALKEKSKIYFRHVIQALKQMSIAWVWALRAIRLLRVVAHHWLPGEYAELMEHALADVSMSANSMLQASSNTPPPLDMSDHNQSWDEIVQQTFDLSWPEGDLFQSGLSLFHLDQWPEI